MLAINGLKSSFFSIPHAVVIFHPVARRVVITTGKWEKSEQHFHQPNEKWRSRRAHMKIRDDANPINIRRIGVSTAFTRISLLIPLPFPDPLPSYPGAPFYRPRMMSYESPFKTSRAPALPEIIFHVS